MVDIPKDVVEIDFTEFVEITSVVPIIEVKAIKKKFVDQMMFASASELMKVNYRVIGKTSEYVILATHDNKLQKMSFSNFRQFLRDCASVTHKEILTSDIWEQVEKVFHDIPQIFTT